MALLSKMLYKRKFLLLLTISSGVLTAAVTLWGTNNLAISSMIEDD